MLIASYSYSLHSKSATHTSLAIANWSTWKWYFGLPVKTGQTSEMKQKISEEKQFFK